MIIALVGNKGGIGKTTSAVALAAFLSSKGRTLLIDGDPNRSATAWARRGSLPFPIVGPEKSSEARLYDHVVVDSQAQPSKADLKELADTCDLLILPSAPNALDLDVLMVTCELLRSMGATHYKALLTMIPPRPSREGDDARAMLVGAGIPLFDGGIRRAVAHTKAALSGVPVYQAYDPRAAAAWADYQAIGEELLG